MDDIYKTIIELQNQIRVLEQRVDDLEDIVDLDNRDKEDNIFNSIGACKRFIDNAVRLFG